MGHGGIAVQHYSFDRAMHSCLVRRFKQHHALLASAAGGSTSHTEAQRLSTDLWAPAMLEWVVDTACVNHDCHNGLKWGLLEWLENAELMKSVFITIESVRNGHSLLEEELGRWLLGVVQWEDEEDLMDPLEAASLWFYGVKMNKHTTRAPTPSPSIHSPPLTTLALSSHPC